MSKRKFIVVFVKDISGSPLVIGSKSIDLKTNKVSFHKKSYLLNMGFPTYTKKNKTFYLVDVDGGQLFSHEVDLDSILSPEVLDQFLSKEIIRQMIAAAKPMGLMDKLLYLVMGLLGGVGIGIMIAGYV